MTKRNISRNKRVNKTGKLKMGIAASDKKSSQQQGAGYQKAFVVFKMGKCNGVFLSIGSSNQQAASKQCHLLIGIEPVTHKMREMAKQGEQENERCNE